MMTVVELRTGQSVMRREAAEAGLAVGRFLGQNEAGLRALGKQLRATPPAVVVTCARGSSDHAATFGKYLIETCVGVPVASGAPSVASVFDARIGCGRALVVVVSQSGRSPDLIALAERYKAAGATIVAFVNEPSSPFEQLADCYFNLCAGPEVSVAATKSFIVSMAALAAVTAAWSDDGKLWQALEELPAQLEQAFALDWSAMVDALVDARNLLVVGRGYGLAAAQEAALKLKETCGLHAEAFSSAEVRHGPMAIIGEGFPVLALSTSDLSGEDVLAVSAEFANRGARVLRACPAQPADRSLPGQPVHLPALRGHPVIESILQIQTFYAAVEELARARGMDPDAPPYLRKVTETL